MRYLDSVSLAKLARMRFDLSRRSGDGAGSGRHRSLSRGFSHEFSQHRAYAPGDELKRLDWKLYARQDRYFVREYHDETLLSAHLLLDCSGSMGFGSKWEAACRAAMGLAYLVAASGDAVGLSAFDDRPREHVPPRAALSHLELIDAALTRLAPGNVADVPAALERLAARLKRRALVVLISDLLGDPERNLAALKATRGRKHEVMVLQVLDRREREFDYEGPILFRSLEDGAELFCDAASLAEGYRLELDRMLRLYDAGLAASEISYGLIRAERPWDEGLSRFLERLAGQ